MDGFVIDRRDCRRRGNGSVRSCGFVSTEWVEIAHVFIRHDHFGGRHGTCLELAAVRRVLPDVTNFVNARLAQLCVMQLQFVTRISASPLFLFAVVLMMIVPLPARAQQQSIVSSARSIDWRRVGIPGGIPPRTTICATLSPGVTAVEIMKALTDCPSGQAVYLSAGTYRLASGISFGFAKSNVTLRGAGANQTFLVFTGVTSCGGLWASVCMQSTDTNYVGNPANTARWTAGYTKGTTTITIDSTTSLSVGDPIILDQLNDTSDDGTIYVCDGLAGGCLEDRAPGGGARPGRAQQQIVTVTAIDGNRVTISPPLYMPNWRASQNPQAWWAADPAFSDGLEDLSIDAQDFQGISSIGIFNCSGCWVKGVRSLKSGRSHVQIHLSPRTVVRDSYFFGSQGSGSTAYGVETFGSSDSLIENNIFQQLPAPQMLSGTCSGCVWAYNYSINNVYFTAAWLQHSIFMHSGGIDNVLLEGNVGVGMYSDAFHGTHHFITVFRNRYNGYETTGPKTNNLNPLNIWPFSRFYNIIGNVLGEAGVQGTYERTPFVGSGPAIYAIGTGTINCCLGGDTPTVATIMRWGNYDTQTDSVRWESSEVPHTLTGPQQPFRNPVPADRVLPASFYYDAQPTWWPSGTPWPAIGPDVMGGNIANTGGHAYRIPAQDCYLTLMRGPADGTGGALSFNASDCYGHAAAGPMPPRNLRIVH